MVKTKVVLGSLIILVTIVLGFRGQVVTSSGLSQASTAFTYQGEVRQDGLPVEGDCDFHFSLWDSSSGGGSIGPQLEFTAVPVADGRFTVQLDFGSTAFSGPSRYLEIAARCPAGSGSYVILTPRQELTATPYAFYATTAPWSGLSGVPDLQLRVTGTCAAGYAMRVVNADGSVTCEPVGGSQGGWSLTGNAGTLPGTNFLGTTDNQPLELRANGERGWRLQPTTSGIPIPNVLGGWGLITPTTVFASVIAGGMDNLLYDNYTAIGGGYNNQAGDGDENPATAAYAAVFAGHDNVASAPMAFVGGGGNNTASGLAAAVCGGGGAAVEDSNSAGGLYSFIGGGRGNSISSSIYGIYSVIGGGAYNTANAAGSVIGGGANNLITGTSDATIGGGAWNIAAGLAATVAGGSDNHAHGDGAAVGGGQDNEATARWATIPGGSSNTAGGDYSFAAGRRAQAYNQGCFIWGDSTYADVQCNTNDRTIFRSSGGYYIYTNAGLTSGMYLAAGGSSWNAVSNRVLKENFASVDTQQLLERLAQVDIGTWNYKAQDPAIRHIGPMADDFNALVDGLGGEGLDYINTLDVDGVALAAIQGLYQKTQTQAARITTLETEKAALQGQLDDLAARVVALENGSTNTAGPSVVGPVLAGVGGLALLATAALLLVRRASLVRGGSR